MRVLGLSLCLLLLACPACGGKSAPAGGSAAEPTPASPLPAGDYACSFSGYPEYLCRITVDGASATLEKLGGSDRFRGALTAAGKGARWTNEVAELPPQELVFELEADGTYFARVESEGEVLGYRLRRLGELGSQFGGQTYAGAIAESP